MTDLQHFLAPDSEGRVRRFGESAFKERAIACGDLSPSPELAAAKPENWASSTRDPKSENGLARGTGGEGGLPYLTDNRRTLLAFIHDANVFTNIHPHIRAPFQENLNSTLNRRADAISPGAAPFENGCPLANCV